MPQESSDSASRPDRPRWLGYAQLAAILAAINAYTKHEQSAARHRSRWAYEGRFRATRNHLRWAARDRR